ncbi:MULTISPECIES: serine hydrolase domain-containing protein [Pseudomonadati]|uniref:Beta-lactamase family protein n=1 Tax=Shewanella aestuarii TaxID=1028752 RepID=A0ABT0KXY2_9GAMM|nr:serine hydrolase domain-containing protein [Shewanella aestuarii]MCL1116032.1 beta-lactamase family protein [Shewanella aestuarii]GGN70065.1 serine hydrolase [Shewanella aestuarii]
MQLRFIITLGLISLLPLSLHCDAKKSLLQSNAFPLNTTEASNAINSRINLIKMATTKAIDQSLLPFSGSVILLDNGDPVLALQKGDEIIAEPSFVIASLSKQITATLILQAVDAGKLNLNRSLNNYLFADVISNTSHLDLETKAGPISPIPNRYDDNISIHHLLSHTSGVAELGKPNRFEPGSQFEYSNFGYALLGELLEKVNQQSFSSQIAQFAQVNHLSALYAEVGSIDAIRVRLPTLAIGLNESDTLIPSNIVIDESLLPAGGLIASAKAFASFQHRLHNGDFISPESYQLMTHSHTSIKFLWPDMSYGYGLRINRQDGITEYSHTGYLPGYMSMSLHYPEFNLDLVMLENISLNLNDLSRVFQLHNQIRQIIREQLLVSK